MINIINVFKAAFKLSRAQIVQTHSQRCDTHCPGIRAGPAGGTAPSC